VNLMKKTWLYFIPIIGFGIFIWTIYRRNYDSNRDDNFQFGGPFSDDLSIVYIFYILLVHIPSMFLVSMNFVLGVRVWPQ
jgi:hypothetical protein